MNRRSYILLVLLFFNLLVWFGVAQATPSAQLKVAFLDIGQGDSILIESPTGGQVLIDGGSGRQVLRALGKQMAFSDRFIDVVIATHPDADHIGGLPSVLERYRVGSFIETGLRSSTTPDQLFLETIAKQKIPILIAWRGMKINLGGGAVLEILFPDRDPVEMETNTSSVVAKLTYGATDFLLTGDSPIAIERYLVGLDGDKIDVEVLKAGHHGSKTSTSQEFVSQTSPDYAVISAGFNNRYGHPHPEVVERLRASGAQVLNTAKVGTILFTTDGTSLKLAD